MEVHRSVHRRPEQYCHDGLGIVLGRGLHSDGHHRGRLDQLRRRRLRAGGVFERLPFIVIDASVGYAGPQTGSTAKGGITCPDDPCAKCGEGGMTGRPRAFYSPPGQPPIPVPAARCAKGINGLTDCTALCQKFPNTPHTTTCCKCYPAC